MPVNVTKNDPQPKTLTSDILCVRVQSMLSYLHQRTSNALVKALGRFTSSRGPIYVFRLSRYFIHATTECRHPIRIGSVARTSRLNDYYRNTMVPDSTARSSQSTYASLLPSAANCCRLVARRCGSAAPRDYSRRRAAFGDNLRPPARSE